MSAKGFAQKIISELEGIRVALRGFHEFLKSKFDSSPLHEHQAKKKDGDADPIVPASVAAADPNPIPAIPRNQTTYEKYTDGLVKIKPWIELSGLIVSQVNYCPW